MRIAVTYENGKVFQHFGHTGSFKIYETEDGKILSAEVTGTEGSGHEALAELLAEKGVELLICGGIGGGAQAALAEAGIRVVSGAEGSADEAVEAWLAGELETAGVNCRHHGESSCGGEESCGEEEHSCGGGCGGCSGCHGEPEILYPGKNAGKTCRVHYRGTYNDGTQFDSSYDRGEPMEFVCGIGMMIPGFDRTVADMEPGESVDIHLMPEEAYGQPDPRAVITVEIRQVPGAESLHTGDRAYLRNSYGQPFPVLVTAKDGEYITFDANHEMAGKELNFHIELTEVL